MLKVKFYEFNEIEDNKLDFAVIMAQFKGKWIFCRHKRRNTWEIAGGHREKGENIENTAKRELYEETGAEEYVIKPICIYSVLRKNGESFGALYYASVNKIGEMPNFEMGEIKLFDELPENLTYKDIQPRIYEKVITELENISA